MKQLSWAATSVSAADIFCDGSALKFFAAVRLYNSVAALYFFMWIPADVERWSRSSGSLRGGIVLHIAKEQEGGLSRLHHEVYVLGL